MAHIIGTVSLSKNVYSLRDIAKFEHINDERIEKLMSDTLKKSVFYSENKSATGVKAFFNEIGANDSSVNMFLTHTKLYPFARAVRLEFEKGYRRGKEIQYAMFCVNKSVYDNWHKNHKPFNASAKPNMSEYGLANVRNTRSVQLKKCPEFAHFEAVVKSLGFKLGEAIMLAVNEYMERHSDVFGNVPHSQIIDESKVRENKMSLIFAYIDPNVTNAVYKALQRYNSMNCPYVKFSEFVESALTEKLDRLPVQYTDPTLYAKMLEVEKAEAEFIKGSETI